MTTMQEALADKYLSASEVPDFLQQTYDLMQRSYANPKYGDEGLRLADSNNQTNQTGTSGPGIPSKRQNKIRSGRSARRAANNQATLAAVGGLSYKGPWDAIKASAKPATYEMCRLESQHKTTNTKQTASYKTKPQQTSSRSTPTPQATTGKYRSSLLAAAIAQHQTSGR